MNLNFERVQNRLDSGKFMLLINNVNIETVWSRYIWIHTSVIILACISFILSLKYIKEIYSLYTKLRTNFKKEGDPSVTIISHIYY